MTVKDIFIRSAHSLTCVALAGIVLAGCSRFQEEDLFDESASTRMAHFNEDLKSRLVKQSSDGNHGWVIQYFVASEFEGFNLFGNFDENGKVTLAGNHRYLRGGNAGKYTESVSFYQMLSEDGPVLAFNTWNDVLTVFVDPVDPSYAPGQLISDGLGMQGDQNLVFQGYKDSTILFSGERNTARVRFVPCDRPWQDYIKDTEANRNYITNTTITSYYVVSGTDTLYFKNLRNGIFTYCERVNDPLFPTTINCVFTPKGFYLQHRNDIAGTTFQEFTLTEDKSRLVSENDSVEVIPTWDTYMVNVRSATWNFDQEGFTDEQKTLMTQLNAALQAAFNSTFNINSVGMGRGKNVASATQGPMIYFNYSYTNKGKTTKASLGISCSTCVPTYGIAKIEVSPNDPVDSNMKNFLDRSKTIDAEALVRQFAATIQGTYKMTPDNYFLPTSVQFTPTESGNAFTLNNN